MSFSQVLALSINFIYIFVDYNKAIILSIGTIDDVYNIKVGFRVLK